MRRWPTALKAVVILVVLVGVAFAVAGSSDVAGTGISLLGDGDSASVGSPERTQTSVVTGRTTGTSTSSVTPTITAMSTKSTTRPTATPAPTPTPTASRPRFPAAKHANDLTRFELSLRSRLARTMRDENRTGVIVLATDYRTAKDGMDELWFVHWECGRAAYIRDQTSSIFTAITNTALEDYGGQPDRVRIYSVSDYNQFPDKTSYIDVAWAKRALDGPMEIDEYEMKYLRTIRTASSDESEIAYEMTVEDSGNETATIAFDQHRDIPSNMSDRDCPWGVEGVNNDEGTG